MKRTIVVFLTLILFASAFALHWPATPARADGIIIIDPPICIEPCPIPPPPPRQTPYLTVQTHRVNVTIADQVATTRVDQTFRNDSQWSLEGTYIFPLPEGAAISDFAMWINGQKVEGQLYTKEEARRIYDDIVRRRLDPALLEYIGRDLFQASIFPIDPGDTRRVEIEYSQILPVDNGLVHYVYPLSTERFSAKPLEDVSVTVAIKSKDPLKAIYSPSHPVSISREGSFGATVGWEEANVLPNTDFSLYYSLSPNDIGVNLLSYKAIDEDGFFVLLVAPTVDAQEVVNKDVILVLDVSGSMEGEKMEQARNALLYVLDHLNEGDRFNVIAFSTGVRAFSTKPEPLSALPEARRFVADLRPEGSTDINRALLEAISAADTERPTTIIFLTDGLPTSGEVETPNILANIDQAAGSNLRIFPFGVGDDVDTVLLDTLAQQQRGVSAYVRPSERVDEKVSSFYAKVGTPVLADLSLDVQGVTLADTYPYPLPDLFAGTQLVLTGRYRNGGPAAITLTGQVNGQTRTFRFDDLTFAGGPGTNNRNAEFIPRLWATRKVGYLLNQIRLHGENKETIDEIINLSVRYGIITPYTSFLVEEPELALSQEGRSRLADEEYAAAAEAPAAVSGAGAVNKAVEQNSLAGADMAAPMPMATATDGGDGSGTGLAANVVMAVGDKAFVLKDGVWTDTTFDSASMTTTQLPFGSDLFFEFMGDHPEAGKYFALGDRVIVVLDGAAYETIPGDISDASGQIEPGAGATPAPSVEVALAPTATPTPARPQPGDSPLPRLSADVTEGVAPLAVNFSVNFIAAAGDEREYNCLSSQFDFGDGNSLSIMTECGGKPNERHDFANYVYDKAGEYQATFMVGGLASAPVTIIVREAGATASPPATPQPVITPTASAGPATATAISPTPVAKQVVPANPPVANADSSIYNVWVFILLPLLGLAVGWFIWGRGK